MEWYYSDGKSQFGPVNEAEFERLQREGTVTSQTLVWNQSLPNWLPWGQVNPIPVPTSPVGGGGGFGSGSALPSWGAPVGQQACTVCGKHFPEGDLMRYESELICAECKPGYFQRLREGASLAGEMVYAGFWIRLVAKIIDTIVLAIFNQIINFGLAAIFGDVANMGRNDPGAIFAFVSMASLIPLTMTFAYFTYFTGKFGATPGKMLLKLKVVMADGTNVSYGIAAGRWFAAALSYFILWMGFIMAAFDEEKRTLHDRIVGTRVIRNT